MKTNIFERKLVAICCLFTLIMAALLILCPCVFICSFPPSACHLLMYSPPAARQQPGLVLRSIGSLSLLVLHLSVLLVSVDFIIFGPRKLEIVRHVGLISMCCSQPPPHWYNHLELGLGRLKYLSV